MYPMLWLRPAYAFKIIIYLTMCLFQTLGDVSLSFHRIEKNQCYAEKQALGEVSSELLDTQVNPAVWEISGHMVLKRKEDYKGASEEKAWRLLSKASLSEERFQEVIVIISKVISSAVMEEKLPEDELDVNNVPCAAAIVPEKHECLVQY